LDSIASRGARIDEVRKQQCLAACRSELGQSACEAEWRCGRDTPIEAACDLTLAWLAA
jgi:hypothetical protein